jgi:hypothetical protein
MKYLHAGIFWTPASAHKALLPPFAVHEDKQSLIFALSTGSESGFDTSYDIANHIALNIVQDVRRDNPSSALLKAQQHLAQLRPPDPDFFNASATALCGVIQKGEVSLSWVGHEQAWHIRRGSVIAQTVPHLARSFVSHMEVPPIFDFIAVRSIGSDTPLDPEHVSSLDAAWQLQSGDCVLIATNKLAHYLNIPEVAKRIRNPHETTRRLMDALPTDMTTQPTGWGAAALCIVVN